MYVRPSNTLAAALAAFLVLFAGQARGQTESRAAVVQPALITQFQQLEDQWSIALAHRDQYVLENLMAPSFTDISAEAAVNTRNQLIVDTLAGLPQPLLSVEQKVVSVRVVSDVAIVEGTYMLRLKEDQKTRDERGIFTHVYQRARNNWSCVSAQRTAVVDQLEGSKGRTTASAKPVAAGGSAGQGSGAAPEKKSNAALPFHIPLLYKGKESSAPDGASQAPAQPAPGQAAPANPPQ